MNCGEHVRIYQKSAITLNKTNKTRQTKQDREVLRGVEIRADDDRHSGPALLVICGLWVCVCPKWSRIVNVDSDMWPPDWVAVVIGRAVCT